jgi:hypothetical protein
MAYRRKKSIAQWHPHEEEMLPAAVNAMNAPGGMPDKWLPFVLFVQ